MELVTPLLRKSGFYWEKCNQQQMQQIILKIVFLHAIEDQKIDQEQKMHIGPQMSKIRVDNQKGVNF